VTAGPRGTSFTGKIRHLLIVDDDIYFADSLWGFLALNGYQTAAAYNANQARDAPGCY
jgi:DNA-binding NtrC family response regulator